MASGKNRPCRNNEVLAVAVVNAHVIMRPRGQTEQNFAASIPDSYNGGIITDRLETFREWLAGEPQ